MPAPISTQFAVAVHVLACLAVAPDGRPVGSPELSTRVDTSPEYVRRVMIPLRAAGVVRSTAGKNGGWVLERDPATLTLADVWRLVHAETALGIHSPDPSCTIGRSITRGLADIERDIADTVAERLATTTICQLLEGTASQRPSATSPLDR